MARSWQQSSKEEQDKLTGIERTRRARQRELGTLDAVAATVHAKNLQPRLAAAGFSSIHQAVRPSRRSEKPGL